MERAETVHIVGKGTDLTFSIKGMPAIKCDGKLNIPDGEVFTAPVKDSVNGILTYNTASLYQGTTFENVCLTFEGGKIVKATANDTEKVNRVFDTDEGARYAVSYTHLDVYKRQDMPDRAVCIRAAHAGAACVQPYVF